MNCALNSTIIVLLVLTCYIISVSSQVSGISCGSCGEECTDACGTRHFRTCCFNYLRKRGSSPPIPTPPDGHQKMWFLNMPINEKMHKHPTSSVVTPINNGQQLEQTNNGNSQLIPQHHISINHHRFMENYPIDENDLAYEYYYKI